MRILVIGGTGFIGPHVVRSLSAKGHEVAVLHRGHTNSDLPAEHIRGERRDLAKIKPHADLVIDLILSSAAQARQTMDTFPGRRVVIASSCDVYKACGILHGSEEGPLQPVPLTEESELRTKLQTYPPAQIAAVKKFYPWVDDDYDKIPVEKIVLEKNGTVCRLPMIYGPLDPARRFFPILRRIADGRKALIFTESAAQWRAPRGYVENVAEAIVLAALNDRAAGRIYNVADTPAFTELEWAKKIAAAANWNGEFIVLPDEKAPALKPPGNLAQHWITDTSRIRAELGYREIVSTEEGIRRTVESDLKNLPENFPLYPIDYAAEDAAEASFRSASS